MIVKAIVVYVAAAEAEYIRDLDVGDVPMPPNYRPFQVDFLSLTPRDNDYSPDTIGLRIWICHA